MTYPIYIPFKKNQTPSGPATFMKNLQLFLDQHQVPYTSDSKKSKVMFFPVLYSLQVLNDIKRQGGYIIQRLDGIYYPSKHGDEYVDLNKDIRKIYSNYADYIIFQSRYSQAQCFVMFGEHKNSSIIANGVQKKIFYPQAIDKNVSPPNFIRFVTTGNFRNIDMLEPIVQALDRIQGQCDFELTVVGPVVNQLLTSYLKREYIRYIGPKPLEDVAAVLRSHHIFLYSHLNPPCPNSVIEAISCGLPVVGFDSGAMAELCFFSKDLLAYVSEDVFQRYEDFKPSAFAEKVMTVVQEYRHYKEIALTYSHLYSFDECGEKYVEIFQRYLQKSPNSSKRWRYMMKYPFQRLRCVVSRGKRTLFKYTFLSGKSLIKRILLGLNSKQLVTMIVQLLRLKLRVLPPKQSLRVLFELENALYELEGQEAVRYGNGVHTKHKHIKYHDFFVRRIAAGSRVLDVGCGNGALAYDIATQVVNGSVYGIDISAHNIEYARQTYPAKNIEYVRGDALCDLPNQAFDVLVLSNVLEHIEKRVDFLQKLQATYQPKKFLIRVPVYERDWRVPLKEELEIDYRLDATHYIEYRRKEFFEEITQAGLDVTHIQINWGEIWAEVNKKTRIESL